MALVPRPLELSRACLALFAQYESDPAFAQEWSRIKAQHGDALRSYLSLWKSAWRGIPVGKWGFRGKRAPWAAPLAQHVPHDLQTLAAPSRRRKRSKEGPLRLAARWTARHYAIGGSPRSERTDWLEHRQ